MDQYEMDKAFKRADKELPTLVDCPVMTLEI